jgi:hypothetical protein
MVATIAELSGGHFYWSCSYDLTHTLQSNICEPRRIPSTSTRSPTLATAATPMSSLSHSESSSSIVFDSNGVAAGDTATSTITTNGDVVVNSNNPIKPTRLLRRHLPLQYAGVGDTVIRHGPRHHNYNNDDDQYVSYVYDQYPCNAHVRPLSQQRVIQRCKRRQHLDHVRNSCATSSMPTHSSHSSSNTHAHAHAHRHMVDMRLPQHQSPQHLQQLQQQRPRINSDNPFAPPSRYAAWQIRARREEWTAARQHAIANERMACRHNHRKRLQHRYDVNHNHNNDVNGALSPSSPMLSIQNNERTHRHTIQLSRVSYPSSPMSATSGHSSIVSAAAESLTSSSSSNSLLSAAASLPSSPTLPVVTHRGHNHTTTHGRASTSTPTPTSLASQTWTPSIATATTQEAIVSYRDNYNSAYIWNGSWLHNCVSLLSLSSYWYTPLVHGYITYELLPCGVSLILISRRTNNRPLPMTHDTGIDMNGNVAAEVEHEQIVAHVTGGISSIVIIRGSPPVYWSYDATLIPARASGILT